MQVPEHLVSLYIATCGQNGPGLGADEKEIILLVYIILEASTGKIIGTKQLLVRPDGNFVKDRTVSGSSDVSISVGASSPPLASQHADAINNNNTSVSNSNTLGKSVHNNLSTTVIHSSNNNAITNGSNSGSVAATSIPETIELPVAVAHSQGKPLQEAIDEFDEYLRSLTLYADNVDSINFITDGQLPLRQCLHREACAKDIRLPSYYNRFCDLRKEFLKFKSGDLSRALVPVKDIKKILQIPTATAPQSIGEMMKELNIPSSEEQEFYVKESRDMVSVIEVMMKGGHKFQANETVNLVLEPGICSIDDDIDGNCIVRARGLPWQSSDQDIAKFFRGLNVAKGGVALCLSPLGRRNGEALIRFVSQEHRDMALKRHKHHIGSRYIEVYRATGEDFLAIAGGASNEAQAFLSKGAQVIIRMRGLPYDCTAKQVLDFFTTGEDPCTVLDGMEGVLFVKKPDGRATGDAFVLFANESDAPKALSRHRESIGQRYIELFRSTTAEVQQVLNRSMDPRTYEANHQQPLISQLPTMPLSLLPQHLITSGTTKNCIRLRGLPYEALVEHILHFLDDFAKHIIFQGVHMVINAQGQPSGEAFIQMDSEESARVCALHKHNRFMMFGKKYRYIEVFQCSGDDMNMVLNGGLQSPVPATALPHHSAAAKQASLLSPGMLPQPSPSNAQAISSHTHAHAHNHGHTHAHIHTHGQSPHMTHAHAHTHALQSSPSMAAAVAALSQQQHVALPSTNAQTVAAITASAGSLSPFMTAAVAAPSNAAQHQTLTAQTNAAAAVAAAAAAAQNAVPLGGLGNAQTSALQMQSNVPNAQTSAMATYPFNYSLPPPQLSMGASSALIAQQQAQYIAQQNLLARQQAAAMAAEQQHQQQQQQLYANLMNPLLFQHPSATGATNATAPSPSAAGAATTHPQYVLMPRQFSFQPLPIGYLPQGYPYAAAAAGLSGAATPAPVAGVMPNAAMTAAAAMPHSMKRSYENAFQHETNIATAAKRALTRPPTAGTPVLGTPFGPFPPFGSPTALLTSAHSHRPLPHHHHQQPTAQAFFPPPFLYWSYPSPPVSPTAYYGQPPNHATTSLAGNISATQHQAMYPLDFMPTVQTSALSPTSITIPSPSNFMTPKQFPALPPPVVPITNGVTGGSIGSRNSVSGLPQYHTKMALPLPMPQQQAGIYHYTAPPSVTGSPQTLPTTPAAVPPLPLTRSATLGALPTVSPGLSLANTTLLTVDTTHNERASVLKTTPPSAKHTGKIPYPREVATSNVEIVSNSCMELYIA